MSTIILNSGGMDSFLLAHYLRNKNCVKHLFINAGQSYNNKELLSALRISRFYGIQLIEEQIINLAPFEDKSSGIIPFRNAEFILTAAQHADNIYLGVIKDEINSDKSPEFFTAMEDVLNISHVQQYWTEGRTFKIRTPLKNKSKSELVKDYLSDGGLLDNLLATVSCYSSSNQHCGQCASCFKRWIALTNATGEDYGFDFMLHPAKWKPLKYWQELSRNYSTSRLSEITDAYSVIMF